ncbi:hypothetical protein B0H11DRAFT_1923926 [Mycena galericulata]|nr:hypothetical protein B0H11DRAFT_1923926 [Mycena galericulata]
MGEWLPPAPLLFAGAALSAGAGPFRWGWLNLEPGREFRFSSAFEHVRTCPTRRKHRRNTLKIIEGKDIWLGEAQKNGIEVCDCVYEEWILIIPCFLAFQGDNPMSSEFASHIAKSDKNNRAPGHAGEFDRLMEFMTVSVVSFMPGIPRTKEETIADLNAQLQRAIDGAPSAVDDMATESGSKDKYIQHFLDKLQAAASKLRDEQKAQIEILIKNE